MKYSILITNKALKELEKIQKSAPNEADRILALFEIFKTSDTPHLLPNAKKLQGYQKENCYRWRIGNYRVIGSIQHSELVIEIVKVATRQEAYKR
ncbi:type II toxin-antitoxin system RelE family toxin [Helicobacter cinaedi]|uniref:type II toxin-antitoxin system RelE family toxin n=1 Tax=Helicobacter cinaedi TaxID=213 RepID=UPI000D7CEAE9|nr:type II toxin-antitoxin system RelE/ParE family toxin [Helicobacter cinaedi]